MEVLRRVVRNYEVRRPNKEKRHVTVFIPAG